MIGRNKGLTMEKQTYSEEFKRAAVAKVLNRGHRPTRLILEDLGVSRSTLYGWQLKFGNVAAMKKSRKRPQDRSPEAKLKLIATFDGLVDEKRGEFLRKQGLRSEHIEGWRRQLSRGLEGGSMTKQERSERAEDRKRIKELERELQRKDKALAEVSALLVLKKKADLIWGKGEGEK